MKLGTIFTEEQYDEAYEYISANGYTIEELEPKDGVRQFKIVEIPQPTEEDVKQARISELKAKLADTDYIVIKIVEGSATADEYAEVLANRKAWRKEINELESVDIVD